MSAFSSSRRAVIGGNWKCNGTVANMKTIIDCINAGGDFPSSSEVGRPWLKRPLGTLLSHYPPQSSLLTPYSLLLTPFSPPPPPKLQVVIAVPAIHLLKAKEMFRTEVNVCSEVR